jgi:hypothetical protein
MANTVCRAWSLHRARHDGNQEHQAAVNQQGHHRRGGAATCHHLPVVPIGMFLASLCTTNYMECVFMRFRSASRPLLRSWPTLSAWTGLSTAHGTRGINTKQQQNSKNKVIIAVYVPCIAAHQEYM